MNCEMKSKLREDCFSFVKWTYFTRLEVRTGQFAGCRLSRLNLQVEFAGQICRSNLQVKFAGQICRSDLQIKK